VVEAWSSLPAAVRAGILAMVQASRTDIDVVWPNEFAGSKPIFPRPKFS
jgi:hypothetical protein